MIDRLLSDLLHGLWRVPCMKLILFLLQLQDIQVDGYSYAVYFLIVYLNISFP